MKNRELFVLNPTANNLLNDGVVEIAVKEEQIIRHELKTFVCEGEYQRGIERILSTYLKHIDQPKQPAVWVSGFFGSGKSHLVKMLGFLWEDYHFGDGQTARTIKELPREVADLLAELNLKQKQYGKLAVTGTLKDFPSSDIRNSFLQLLLNALDLPPLYHQFKFVHWAKQEGIYDALETELAANGKKLRNEISNMFVSTPLAQAVLNVKPGFADTEAQVKENFKHNFKRRDSISREEFIQTIKDEILPLKFGNKIPCTILVLDEVQQFIDKDGNKTIDIQNLAQDLCSGFDGRFLLIGTGQNALSETPFLQPLIDRFSVKVSLSDTDVETVTRKTVLQKKPSVIADVTRKLDEASGEIARNLSGSDYGYTSSDQINLTADYPILPSTRKFWKRVLQVIDTAGTAGQLRSQLRIVDDSVKAVAENELGQVVPADFIFRQKQQQLLQNALLLNETNNLIETRLKGSNPLEGRILSIVFLIDRLPQDVGGARLLSDENTIADLLVSDLNGSSEPFRLGVKKTIEKLVDEKVLMPVGREYKLQTKVGAEWEQEFTTHATKLTNSGDDRIQQFRKERINQYVKDKSKTINIQQGVSKEKRDFVIYSGKERPATSSQLHVWVRDGWFDNEGITKDEIRAEGADTPLAYVYVRKQRDAELRAEIVKYLAAEATLQTKGIVTTPEGEQARKGMETRKETALRNISDLIDLVSKDALVFLAGGIQVDRGTLRDNIEEALTKLADRQYSDFQKADFKDWDKALAKAFGKDPDALKRINYNDDAKEHPAAKAILAFMGIGKRSGREIRQQFEKAPYGWSRDAIDTILVLLTYSEVISTDESALTQAKIPAAEFKREVHTLTAPQKIKLRKVFQDANVQCKNREEFIASNEYLTKLMALASLAGGDAPRQAPVSISHLKDLQNLEGNERLVKILESESQLKDNYVTWTKQAETTERRMKDWQLLERLFHFTPATVEVEAIQKEATAILDDRLLLAEPDPVSPLLARLTDLLKTLLVNAKQRYNDLFDVEMAKLQANSHFAGLKPEEKHRILVTHNIKEKPKSEPTDAKNLLTQLEKRNLDGWNTKIKALPAEFEAALQDAIRLSAPKAVTFSLPRPTINTKADINAYIAELRKSLEELLDDAPAIILK